ncbi:hypothetical protein ACFRAO_07315 [Streptomyces sp. NPDC056656]|uniref:hypothetical protein n=1 Tax=Streptomyces sp. NPDC056656 TaxID=3345895 RepID=UPI0036BD57BC
MSSIPFPTTVLEDYGDQFLAPGLYGAVIGTAALSLFQAGSSDRELDSPAQRRSSW